MSKIPLELTASLATDVSIQNNIFGSGMTTLVISNLETNDVIKKVKSLEDSGLLIKWVSKIIENKAKEQKCGFQGMLLGTLGVSLFGNLWTSKEVVRAGKCTIND